MKLKTKLSKLRHDGHITDAEYAIIINVLNKFSTQPCKNWYDVPSDEMTLEQARQAVKDLRKKLAEYLEQQPYEDAISREEAIRVAEQGQIQGYEWQFKKLCNLPPVTPKQKTRKSIIDADKLDEIIVDAIDASTNKIECQTLRWVLDKISELSSVTPQEQQPCEDCISRAKAIEICKTRGHDNSAHYISELPPVTPQQKIGHWIDFDSLDGALWHTCSECGETEFYATDYCPNCGARMEVANDE